MNDGFRRLAALISKKVGSSYAFVLAILIIIAWAVSGPVFGFSDTWQLIINTGTTIVTFLMVFLIQNTQNRDSKAMQLKLDELIKVTRNASNKLIDLEDLSDHEIAELESHFRRRVSQSSEPKQSFSLQRQLEIIRRRRSKE
jgi:low affinity Fe/Cu permease